MLFNVGGKFFNVGLIKFREIERNFDGMFGNRLVECFNCMTHNVAFFLGLVQNERNMTVNDRSFEFV